MAAAGVKNDGLTAEGVPHLSFNPDITRTEDLPSQLTEDEIRELKNKDPKLLCTWTLWEQRVAAKTKNLDYSGQTKEITSFRTIKEFWACFNHIPQPSILFSGKRYARKERDGDTFVEALMIFKKGVRPEWEDPENAKGGHFQLQIKPNQSGSGATVDELWNNIVLTMIAGMIEPADMITGIRLVDKLTAKKPCVRIELWFNEMEKGQGTRTFDLKDSFEKCMRTATDGTMRPVTWGYTEICEHAPQAA
jgi:translation initiation factor 4E